jgi:hypothetical protein
MGDQDGNYKRILDELASLKSQLAPQRKRARRRDMIQFIRALECVESSISSFDDIQLGYNPGLANRLQLVTIKVLFFKKLGIEFYLLVSLNTTANISPLFVRRHGPSSKKTCRHI